MPYNLGNTNSTRAIQICFQSDHRRERIQGLRTRTTSLRYLEKHALIIRRALSAALESPSDHVNNPKLHRRATATTSKYSLFDRGYRIAFNFVLFLVWLSDWLAPVFGFLSTRVTTEDLLIFVWKPATICELLQPTVEIDKKNLSLVRSWLE